MDFTRALTYPFDDPDWLKKLGIGVLLTVGGAILSFLLLIPTIVVGILFAGWQLEIMKRVRNNDPMPLPGWDDFSGLLKQGFTLFLAGVVYQIPTIIYACVISAIWLLPALSGGDEDAAAALAGTAGFIAICCSCIIVLYAIAAAVVYWGGMVRFVDRPELNTFFQVGENFAIVRDNLGDFGMALLYFILAGAIVSVASSVTFGLAGLVSQVFITYFGGHILGQLAAKVGSGAAPRV